MKGFMKYCSIVMLLFLFGCGGGGGSTPPPTDTGGSTPPSTYSISGKITYNGAGIPGVAVHLASSNTSVVIPDEVSDSTGTYTFKNVPDGTYTVSSTDTKYGFEPQTVTVNGADQPVADIVTFPVFTVTGKITLDGTGFKGVAVTLYKTSFSIYIIDGLYGTTAPTLNSTGTVTVTTALDGVYTFNGVRSGSYTVVPLHSGYVFNPDKSSVISITDSGNIFYAYDPTKTGNSVIGNTIIYNSSFSFTGNTIPLPDFTASIPGGV